MRDEDRELVVRLRYGTALLNNGALVELAGEAAAEIERLRALVKDLADDVAAEVEGHYRDIKDHPAMRPKYERDMANVYRARRVLEGKA